MPIPVGLLAAGAGALLKGVGGLLGGNAKKKKEQEQARLAEEAARRGWDQKESTRVALLKSLQSRAGTSGPKVAALLSGMDPSLLTPRAYAGPVAGQETGTSTLGSVLQGVGGLASAYGDYDQQKQAEGDREAKQNELLCAIVPTMPGCGVPSEAPAGSVGGYVGEIGG